MSRLSQKKREFKTSDIISMFGLVGIVATLSGVVLARSLDDDRPARTRISAEALSLQLSSQLKTQLANAANVETSSMGRVPASINGADSGSNSGKVPQVSDGELSRDPWGHPFHYHMTTTTSGRRRVIVWSDGPNQKSDSDASVQTLELAKNAGGRGSSTGRETGGSFFRGDDIGFSHEE